MGERGSAKKKKKSFSAESEHTVHTNNKHTQYVEGREIEGGTEEKRDR